MMLVHLITVVSLAIYISASPQPQERRGKAQVITSCSVPNTVALTFDDGPYLYTEDVVNTLKNAGGKGTFFLNGNNYRCIYDEPLPTYVKYAYENGFQIASHTWAHKDLVSLSEGEINQQLSLIDDAIRKITGASPAYLRPPYGSYNDLVQHIAASRNQTLVLWDFDSKDSEGASVEDQKALFDDVIQRHPQNILSLQHEVHDTTVQQVLPYAVDKLKAAGYKLVTLAECLGQSPYSAVGSPSNRDGSWTCATT